MLPAGEPSIFHNNRAFCFGDAIFETIHANGTRLQFFHEHFKRLERSMKILKIEKSSYLEFSYLESLLVRLLNKNQLYKGARIRLTVFRNSGGLYTPEDNSCSFIAESTPLPFDNYRLNEKGLMTDIYTLIPKYSGPLANLKTANSLVYVMAGIFRNENSLDDCIILNEKERPAESISSNLFIRKDGVLYTPPLSEGCVDGIMRGQIIRIAGDEGIGCIETALSVDDLIRADECFMTNSISGIRWVVAFRDKRYYSKTSRLLTDRLNSEQFDM